MGLNFKHTFTILYHREFRQRCGHFKAGGGGTQKNGWISKKGTSAAPAADLAEKSEAHLNTQYLRLHPRRAIGEGRTGEVVGIWSEPSYSISKSTANVWMGKLRCKYERHTQSYYSDCYERPDAVDSSKEFMRKKLTVQLRQDCRYSAMEDALMPDELAAFEVMRQTGEEAFWADTYRHDKIQQVTSRFMSTFWETDPTNNTMSYANS